jgi:hypothetical protein
VQLRTGEHVLFCNRAGQAIGQTGQLHDQRERHRSDTQDVGDAGDPFVADERDFHRFAFGRGTYQRHDARFWKVRPAGALVRATEACPSLKRNGLEFIGHAREHLWCRLG